MEFKKKYFDSGREYNKKSLLYQLKELFFSEKLTKIHYNLLLLNKWKYFRFQKKILDAGSGLLEFLRLNPYKKEIYGIDINKNAVEEAKKQGFNVSLGDVNKRLKFSDNSFDGLNCSHVIEHLDDASNALSEFRRVLKDKGIIVITVPNYSFKEFYNDYTHKRPYTKMSLYRLLRDNGFKNIRIDNGPYLNKWLSMMFFMFPRIRFSIELFLGKIWPSEFMAVARNSKDSGIQ